MYYYLYLSGEHRTLPEAEVRAIAEAESINLKRVIRLDQILVLEADKGLIDFIKVRAALTKVGGILIDVVDIGEGVDGIVKALKDADQDLINNVRAFRFSRVKEYGKGKIEFEHLRSILKEKLGLNALLREGDSGVLDIIVSNAVILGIRMFRRNIKDFEDRAPQRRPVYRPGTLPPLISRVFVNLSRVSIKGKSKLLDPFCGVAGFLLEACVMGLDNYIGVDINEDYVRGARINLEFYDCPPNVLSGDACNLPLDLGRVDAIATDPPYGRLTRAEGRTLKELMVCFLEEAGKVLRKGSYVVFAQKKGVIGEDEIEDLGPFKVVEKHINWVHGSLTRDVYVVKRI